MKGEEARMERCGETGCGRKAPLTIRIEAPGESQFRIFCKRHFATAMEFVRSFWINKGAAIEGEASWDCGREKCGKKAVMTFRIRTEEGPEMMSFCRGHLCVAFEIAAKLNEEEAA